MVGLADEGGWAELAAVPNDRLAVLPDDVSFEAASTLPVAGLTALRALEVGGPLLGRRVLVTGAAGGVGRFAIQLAHRAGAHVTGVVRNAERGEGLRELGADELITELEPEGEPFDLLLESVGGASLAAALTRVAPAAARSSPSAPPRPSRPRSTSRASTTAAAPRLYGLRVFDELAMHRSGVRDLDAAGRRARRRPARPADRPRRRAGEDANTASHALMDRRVAGKAVLTVG